MSKDFFNEERTFSFQQDRLTWAVQRLILANVCVFAGLLLLEPFVGGRMSAELAFSPDMFLRWFRLWQPITYMFCHAGLMHLFTNMLMLFFFGPEVERTLGTRQFLWFYGLCGALGVMVRFVPYAMGGGHVMTVGASGAVLGVLVAYALVNPDRQTFLFPIPIPVSARGLVMIIIGMNILMALGSGNTTDVLTHFGGMGVAFAYMKFVPKLRGLQRKRFRKKPKKTKGDKKLDKTGRVVDDMFKDNVFDFDDEKRRRG